jgi:hypothetical protein
MLHLRTLHKILRKNIESRNCADGLVNERDTERWVKDRDQLFRKIQIIAYSIHL